MAESDQTHNKGHWARVPVWEPGAGGGLGTGHVTTLNLWQTGDGRYYQGPGPQAMEVILDRVPGENYFKPRYVKRQMHNQDDSPTNPDTDPDPDKDKDTGPDYTIPEDAYPKSWTGLPGWSAKIADSSLHNYSNVYDVLLGKLRNYFNGIKPMDWYGNLSKSTGYFSGEAQGTRNTLLRDLQDQLLHGDNTARNVMAARGMPQSSSALTPGLWREGLNAYSKQMGATDQWAAQQARGFTEAMAKGKDQEAQTFGNMFTGGANALAALLNSTRESHWSDKLAPYKLLLQNT